MRQRRKTHRRGRTRPKRLALIDRLLEIGALPLPAGDQRFVDVGFGDEPSTTLRLHERLSKVLELETIGVEVEMSRVERAQEVATSGLRFCHGGFDLRSAGLTNATLVRCFNVLRGYGLWDVKPALLQMSASLRVGGLLIEGTTDVEGSLLSAHVWKRPSEETMNYIGMVCATDFSRGFSPLMFRDVLPRDLRRHAKPGEPVFEWLTAWEGICSHQRQKSKKPDDAQSANKQLFSDSLQELEGQFPPTDTQWSEHGTVIWRPERPSTRPEVLSPDDPIPR